MASGTIKAVPSRGEFNSLSNAVSNKVDTSAIANNVSTTSAGYVLDARQGKALNDAVNSYPSMTSNSNGIAWKFPTGLMICAKSISQTLDVSASWGSLYDSKSMIDFGNFAQSFTGTPYIAATVVNAAMGGWIERVEGATASYAGKAYIVRPTTQTNRINVDIIAIGRWK